MQRALTTNGAAAKASLEDHMNEDTLKGQWMQLKGKVRERCA